MDNLIFLANLWRAIEGLLGVDHEYFVRGRQSGGCPLQHGQESAERIGLLVSRQHDG